MKRGELRIELVIATLALAASAAASVATVVQTHVVGNQLSASVWPYLSFDTTISPGRLALRVDNDGLGPALVRNVRLTVDGQPKTAWRTVLPLFGRRTGTAAPHAVRSRASVTESDISVQTVIRPGSSINVIEVRNASIDNVTGDAIKRRIDMQICYCSILQQCWTVALISDAQPKSVNDCGPPGPPLVY